ncbi:MAG TPA: hypothetical protein VKG24_24360 [Pseudolabrys sp.]|nr:hypothetical protein [Pseudolabrys sp.]
MPSAKERLEKARRHVEWGRFVILRQKQLIEKFRAEGRDTAAADQLLLVLERTQKVLEYDLADLERRNRLLSRSG